MQAIGEDAFESYFGHPPQYVRSAPGRVNLIGEHTDYNGGYVLPMAIPYATRCLLARCDGPRVRVVSLGVVSLGVASLGVASLGVVSLGVVSLGHDDGRVYAYELGDEKKRARWYDFIQGVTFALRLQGDALTGFDALFESTVPIGSGLSSSAALTVATTRTLREAYRLSLTDEEVAMIAHRAEHDFVGVPVGIMDPMASSLGDEHSALFLDTYSMQHSRIEMPEHAEVVIIDSGVKHAHAEGAYRVRRSECEEAASLLGVRFLREVDESQLARLADLPEPLGRRARHVVTENARVLRAVEALRAGDLGTLGRLFDESYASMRDDFEISVPAVDRLVTSLRVQPATYGARMTGGGFGGAVVALVRKGEGRAVAQAARKTYEAGGSECAKVLLGGGLP